MTKLKSLNYLWLLLIIPIMFLFVGCGTDNSKSQLNQTATCQTQTESAYTSEGAGEAYTAKVTTDETSGEVSNNFSKGYRMTMKMNMLGSIEMNAIFVDNNMAIKMKMDMDLSAFGDLTSDEASAEDTSAEIYMWKKDNTLYMSSEGKDEKGNTQKTSVKYTMTAEQLEGFLKSSKVRAYSVADVLDCVKNIDNENITIKVAGENSFKIEFRGLGLDAFDLFDPMEQAAVPMDAEQTFAADIYVNFNSNKTINSIKAVYNMTSGETTTTVFELTMSEYNGSITFPKDSDFSAADPNTLA
ncbi:MAG: hypothetical protein IJ837_03615 [Clostridia bacterium]|nr:hypothetical protein [Clostridia bacterium]